MRQRTQHTPSNFQIKSRTFETVLTVTLSEEGNLKVLLGLNDSMKKGPAKCPPHTQVSLLHSAPHVDLILYIYSVLNQSYF